MKKALMASVLSIFLGASVLFSGCGSTDLSEINKQIADLQQQITESNKIIDNLENQIADSNQTIDNLENQIADSNQTIDNLENQIADSNQTIDNLESQIADSNQTSENLKSQITSLNQTILELQTELQNATGNISSLQSQLAIASANYDKLYNQVYGEQNSYYNIGDTYSYSSGGIKLFDFTIDQAIYNTNGNFHYIRYTFNSYIIGIDSIESESLNLTFLFYDNSTNQTYEVFDTTSNIITFTSGIPDQTRSGLIYLYVGNLISCIFEINFAELSS